MPKKKMKPGADREMAAPSVTEDTAAPEQDPQDAEGYAVQQQARRQPPAVPTTRRATSPFSDVDDGSDEMAQDADASASKLAMPQSAVPAAAAATKKNAPTTYQEAAKLIRADKALYAQYKAGIDSGKAFSLNVGGKSFAYAATSQAKPAGNASSSKRENAAQPAKKQVAGKLTADEQSWKDYKNRTGDYAPDGKYGKQEAARVQNAAKQTESQKQPVINGQQAAESIATPEDTAANKSIGVANSRKMKAKPS